MSHGLDIKIMSSYSSSCFQSVSNDFETSYEYSSMATDHKLLFDHSTNL